MKKLFLLLITFTINIVVSAQEIPKMSVTSFELAETDNTANLSGTMVRDQNGDPCALIRVQTTQTGFVWDFGQMQPIKIEQKTGEIWIYIPYGVKKVTIRHPKYDSITYDFPIPVQKARTYFMRIVATGFTIIVDQEITQQWVVFNMEPSYALVEIDGQILETKNGIAKKKLKFGKYNYTVSAGNYHPYSGVVNVTDNEGTIEININLDPAFGKIKFADNELLTGTKIFFDDDYVGLLPMAESIKLSSGQHNLKLVKSKYKPYYQTVNISDGSQIMIDPVLVPNFANVFITTKPGAEIWANDEKLGVAPWEGELEYGSYSFEVKAESHRSVYHNLDFREDTKTDIELPEPIPVYGSLSIDCEQTAILKIDGQERGKTPQIISKLLIGNHEIELAADGFNTYRETVNIEEGKEKEMSVVLSEQLNFASSYSGDNQSYSAAYSSPSEPKIYKNIFKFGYSPMKFTDKKHESYHSSSEETPKYVMHTHSISASYKRYFIKRYIGASVGVDLIYIFRTNFNNVDYHLLAASVPVDFIARFGSEWWGYLRLNAGLFIGTEVYGVGISKLVPYTGSITKDLAYDLPCVGFQVGFMYEYKRLALGYNYSGNITSVFSSDWNDGPHSSDNTRLSSHRLSIGVFF